jgi:O-antigen/teichoic acid export membrane protein
MSAIKKNYIYNLTLTLSNILFPIITIPYVSRILGPEGMGKIQFVNSFSQYFILIAALGIPVYGTREIAKIKSQKKELSQLFTSLILINFLTVFFISIVYFMIIFSFKNFDNERKLFFAASMIIILSFANIDWFYSGLEKYKFIAIRSIVVKLIFAVILFFFVKTNNDVLNYLYILVASSVLNNLINIFLSRKYINFYKLTFPNLLKHIKPLVLIFSSIFVASMYSTIDTLILGILKGYKDVGFYSAASRITKMTIPILTSMSIVLLPMLAVAFKERNFEQLKNVSKKSIDFVLLIGIPMSLGLYVLSPELIRLFSGNNFDPAIMSMKILSPLVVVIGLSTIFAVQILTPASLDLEVSASVLFGLLLSLVLNFFLIPKMGFIGASISNILSEILVMILFYFQTKKVVNNIFDLKNALKYFFISLFFFPIVYVFRSFTNQNFIIVFCSIISCSIWYLLMQYFFLKNNFIHDQLKKIKKRFI